MGKNVSSNLLQLLNEQISHEGYNAQLYLKIGTYLRNKGLNKMAAHFIGQVDEEHSHQKKIADYLTDRNEEVLALTIPEVALSFTGIKQIAFLYLKQEQDTTAKLKSIARAAFEENDLLTFRFLQEVLEYQRSEEDEALTFQDKAELANDDWQTILLWDANFSL